MARVGKLLRADTGDVLLNRVQWCDSFGCKLRGLMFRSSLSPDEGLLLVESHPSRTGTSIHMFFMRFPIAAVWLDEDLMIVDKVQAKIWRPVYVPSRPAQFVLEAHPDLFDAIQVGDVVRFEQTTA